jgi:ABC-2 type transport system permease protein
MTLARERERGTIEQLIASPVGRHELMLGKISPYMLIAFADVLLVTAVGTLLFGVPLRGSLLLLFGLSALFLVSALGIGLFISTLARTQQVAMITALLTTMLPSILLSGFIFPVRSMPKILQGVSQVIPATHFLVIARGIFLKGVGLETLWPQVVILILLGVFWLSLSALRFQKRL